MDLPPAPTHFDTLKRPPNIKNEPVSCVDSSGAGTAPYRPQISKRGPSSSPLQGLERSVPPFQAFLRQTRPVHRHDNKPLPPVPRRSKQSLAHSPFTAKRSSSVYSQSPADWTPESDGSWEALGFDDPLAQVLQPIAYSISTPDLTGRHASLEILHPRTFSPLITSPSPTLSAETTPDSMSPSRPLTPLLLPSMVPTSSRKKPTTLSLEQARQEINAPGAIHLLPEELRDQKLNKTRTKDDSISADIAASPTSFSTTPTLIDNQGRRRMLSTPLSSPKRSTAAYTEFPFFEPPSSTASLPYIQAFHVGTGPIRPMAPPVPEQRKYSRDNSHPFVNDGERGRRLERGGRRNYEDPTPNPSSGERLFVDEMVPIARTTGISDPHLVSMAEQCHSIVSRGYESSNNISSPRSSTNGVVRTHMKMIPQPLFAGPFGKQPVQKSGSLRSAGTCSLHRNDRTDSTSSSGPETSSRFPLSLNITPPQSMHSRGSKSSFTGVIPISPPSDRGKRMQGRVPMFLPRPPPPPPPSLQALPQLSHSPQSKQKGRDWERNQNRESQFYPHVMRRRPLTPSSSTTNKTRRKRAVPPEITPGKPLSPPDLIVSRFKTPETLPLGSPESQRQREKNMEQEKGKGSIPQRARGRLGISISNSDDGSGTSPSSPETPSSLKSTTTPSPSPSSSHLLPSPVHGRNHDRFRVALNLGRSASTKERFNSANTSPPTTSSSAAVARGKSEDNGKEKVTHHIQPARPLDKRNHETPSPTSPSLLPGQFLQSLSLGGVLDRFKTAAANINVHNHRGTETEDVNDDDDEAERRRAEIRRMIRVVPMVSSSVRPVPGESSGSGAGGMDARARREMNEERLRREEKGERVRREGKEMEEMEMRRPRPRLVQRLSSGLGTGVGMMETMNGYKWV